MKLGLWISIFFLAFAQSGATEETRVISGEHDTFTRLVILPNTRIESWSTESSGRDHTISFSGAKRALDVGSVYNKIPRTRLSEIKFEPETSSLVLKLGCDCPISIFRVGERFLAIDINDPSEASSDQENKTPLRRRGLPPLYQTLPVFESRPSTPRLKQADPKDMRSAPPPAPVENSLVKTDELMRRIAQDIVGGFLDANLTPDSLPDRDVESATSESAIGDPSETARDQHSIRTASQSTLPSADSTFVRDKIQGKSCYPHALLSREIPLDLHELISRLSTIRSNLFKFAGDANEASTRDLVFVYLGLGLGVEARRLLEEMPTDLEADLVEILTAISMIIEGSQATPFFEDFRFDACSSELSLWALLSADTAPHLEVAHEHVIWRLFEGLPIPLQDQLGSRFRAKMEDLEARRTSPSPSHNTTNSAVVKQTKASMSGAIPKPQLLPSAKVDRRNETGPAPEWVDALEEFLRRKVDTGETVDEETLVLAESFASEYSDYSFSLRLFELAILGRALRGEWDHVFDEYELLKNLHPDEGTLRASVKGVAKVGVMTEEISSFLQISFSGEMDRWLQTLSDEARTSYATRLAALGFSERAAQFLQ